jgi:uncharacterized protein (TIGR02145 family)
MQIQNVIRIVCSTGWYVPSTSEFYEQINFVGGARVAGGIVRETNVWNSSNTGAADAYVFSVLPGGYRDTKGVFKNQGNYGHRWTTCDSACIHKKWLMVMSPLNAIAACSTIAGGNVMSCRCKKTRVYSCCELFRVLLKTRLIRKRKTPNVKSLGFFLGFPWHRLELNQ